MIIAITGPSASGKSTLVRQFSSTVVVSQDQYYLGEFETREGKQRDCDHPASCDLDQLFLDLKTLKQGQSVMIPKYDFLAQKRIGKRTITPKSMIVVEGLWTLYHPGIRELADLKIYVDAPFSIRIQRMIERDEARGRNAFQTLGYVKHVEIMMKKFVEPYKKYANLVINSV